MNSVPHVVSYVVSQGAPKGRRAVVLPSKLTAEVARTVALIALKEPVALGFWKEPAKALVDAFIIMMREEARKVIATNRVIAASKLPESELTRISKRGLRAFRRADQIHTQRQLNTVTT